MSHIDYPLKAIYGKQQLADGTEIDFDAHYAIKGWRGVAWLLIGWKRVWEQARGLVEYCEDCNRVACGQREGQPHHIKEIEEDIDGEGEWVDDVESRTVVACMVGDDGKHEFNIKDLTLLDELAFCHSCGQVGCTHDGLDRSAQEHGGEG